MPDEQSQANEASQAVRWLDGDVNTVYANLMEAGFTPFDISVVFGEVRNATAGEVWGVPRVRLTLSPEQASALMQILEVALERFQEQIGPLRSKAISVKKGSLAGPRPKAV